MLVKEYRILIPLSVDEYRIAQLYMIQKKSQVDTSGAGSGVEILKNEPYEDGPGGKGQYTYKVYHIGSHLPSSFRSILPSSALRVEEEAWNAYPYTKTRFTCPFVERFSLEVTTVYFNDAGTRENVFELKGAELSERVVDYMDFVKDPISMMDYCKEEDPKLYKSKKTNRGPLDDDWVKKSVKDGETIMCAYKLCRVEFRYWGMQSKIEKFIHDIALRKTMLRAHRQAWAWQDEWYGLTIDDIRRLEKEAQENLHVKMQAALSAVEGGESAPYLPETTDSTAGTVSPAVPGSPTEEAPKKKVSEGQLRRENWRQTSPPGSLRSMEGSALQRDALEAIRSDSDSDDDFFDAAESMDDSFSADTFMAHRPNVVRWSSVEMLAIEEESTGSPPLTPGVGSPRGAGDLGSSGECPVTLLIVVFHGGSSVDCAGGNLGQSQENLSNSLPPSTPNTISKQTDIQTFVTTLDMVLRTHYPQLWGRVAVRMVSCPNIGAEAINLLASLSPYGSEHLSDSAAMGANLESCHPSLIPILAADSFQYDDNVLLTIHRANQVYADFMCSEEGNGFSGEVCVVGDAMGGVLAYDSLVKQRTSSLSRNPSQMSARSDLTDVSGLGMPIPEGEPLDESAFQSEDEKASDHSNLSNGFPQNDNVNETQKIKRRISSDGDQGLLRNNDSKTPTPRADGDSQARTDAQADAQRQNLSTKHSTSLAPTMERGISTAPSQGSKRSESSEGEGLQRTRSLRKKRLDFRVSSLFLVGTPLGLVLAHRKIARGVNGGDYFPLAPACNQVCNLYYAIDPCCARLEPLLCHPFCRLPPVNVPRYSRFPLGDGQSLHLLDCIQRHHEDIISSMGVRESAHPDGLGSRKYSTVSTSSDAESPISATISAFQNITGKWWGSRRIDLALYCPEGLATLPLRALPNLLHSSFWESSDVAAFLIRQFVTGEDFGFSATASTKASLGSGIPGGAPMFTPTGPTEKWSKKRTSFKIRNTTANHRANDTIVTELQPQVLHARFMYGPLDVVALGGEKVDVYIKTETGSSNGQSPGADWTNFGTDTTDTHGRLAYSIPEDKQLALGLYPVKMVVKGDHTYLDMFLAVVPPQTECVVFSIDGSFTASMSVSGKDPKVRPGAVDVVRHWQDLGYLVLYVTARPDMQQRRVISWLAQHNFPHGLLFFTEGISTDLLKQKTQYLKQLVDQRQLIIHAGYGSAKDINVYDAAGVNPTNIFVIGKVTKKLQSQCQSIIEGYSVHLTQLTSGDLQTVGRPAQGNGRLILRKGCFSLPGQYRSVTVQRSHSFTPRTGKYGVQRSGVQGLQTGPHNSGGLMSVHSVGPDLFRVASTKEKKSRTLSPFRMISRHSMKLKSKSERPEE